MDMVLDKYFVYTIKSFNSIIEGSIFLNDNDKGKQVSLNTTNKFINKFKYFKRKNG